MPDKNELKLTKRARALEWTHALPLTSVFYGRRRRERKVVKSWTSMLLVAFAVGHASAQQESQEPFDPNWRLKAERRILERLDASPDLVLKCDFVLNPVGDRASFAVPVVGKTTILNFWRPSCGPCKPLLKKLGAFSRKPVSDIAVLGAAEASSSYGERGDVPKARELISGIVTRYEVPFPMCGYTDHSQTKKWQAEGVPLTLFFDAGGRVRRVAMGADEAARALKQLEKGWRP